jgi:hypothetical protein
MGIDNDWLLENMARGYSLGMIDDAVDSLIEEYESLMRKIRDDDRNYMIEAVSTMKNKIITSKIEDVLELVNPDAITDGSEFRTIGSSSLSIVASMYLDGSTDQSAMNIQKIVGLMADSFIHKEEVLMSPIQPSYLGANNLYSVADIQSTKAALSKTESVVTLPFGEVEQVDLQDMRAVINKKSFLERYIGSRFYTTIDSIRMSIGNALREVRLTSIDAPFIEYDISDAELKGSGSKMTDNEVLSPASPSSDYIDEIFVLLNYEDDYSISINGTTYTYTANDSDTPEDIAAGLSGAISDDTSLNVSTNTGYWSIVYENSDGDKVFGWYAENTDDSVQYSVEMVVPSDTHDLTIEQDGTNPEKIIITFEHDGFDPVYPTIGDLRDLVNGFEDVDIRVVVMPGFDLDNEYSSADAFDLEQGASKIVISAARNLSVDISGISDADHKTVYTHVAAYSPGESQVSRIEVVKFNPSDTFSITIDGNTVTIDPSLPENSGIIDEPTLAQAFSSEINSGSYGVTSSVAGAVITITGEGTDPIDITTSGENNYVVPIDRDSLVKYDIRNIPDVTGSSIPQLYKEGGTITDIREPLTKGDVSKIKSSGYVYSRVSMMIPQVPQVVDNTDNFVDRISTPATQLEALVRKEENLVLGAHKNVAPVLRSFPEIEFPIFATSQAKSNRWFFVEAGGNSIASSTSIGIALSTISPYDYERLVFKDDDAVFSAALSNRVPNVGQKYESILSLLTESTRPYNASGLHAAMSITSDIFGDRSIDRIKSELTKEQLDGFIKYAMLPPIIEGSGDYEEAIYSQNPTRLYLDLMELAIQIDDALIEQRFIALAGAYIADASELTSLFADYRYAEYVFGVNESETPPEDNYGIGGVPIDATVTMSKLYFRNMRNQAMMLSEKPYSIPIPDSRTIAAIAALPIFGIELSTTGPARVVMGDGTVYTSSFEVLSDIKAYIDHPPVTDTDAENFVVSEIARTGYFSSNIDLGISKCTSGISNRYKTTVWTELMDGIEIADDGSIRSVNSAKSYLQSLYQSYADLTEEQMVIMLSSYEFLSGGFDDSVDHNRNSYSALTTLFLKIFLYLKEKKDTIAYADWESTFDSIVGKLFMDDELETEILPYELFVAWVCGIGGHVAFSDSDTISTDGTSYISDYISDAEVLLSSLTRSPPEGISDSKSISVKVDDYGRHGASLSLTGE